MAKARQSAAARQAAAAKTRATTRAGQKTRARQALADSLKKPKKKKTPLRRGKAKGKSSGGVRDGSK